MYQSIMSVSSATSVPSFSGLKISFSKKTLKTLSTTEKRILAEIESNPLQFGFISHAILYAKEFDRFSNAEKKAIFNLLYNEFLEIAEIYDTASYRILRVKQ